MARPIIALLTDFGLRDHYVGTMKGVMLGICPDATLVDLNHDIPPQDIMTGALELATSYRYFPAGTIFVAVVDPGVGSSRRAIAADGGGYRFVGPDNGVLSVALGEVASPRVFELSDPRYARPSISRTFEGRDRFAPAAAWLASGIDVSVVGDPIDAFVRLELARPIVTTAAIEGEVLRVDRFGNLITNIDRPQLDAFLGGGTAVVSVNARRIPGIVGTYADVGEGDLCALVGSSDRLEISLRGGSAAASLGAWPGTAVHVRRAA